MLLCLAGYSESIDQKQAQLSTIHSLDFQTKIVQSKGMVGDWMLLNLLVLPLAVRVLHSTNDALDHHFEIEREYYPYKVNVSTKRFYIP